MTWANCKTMIDSEAALRIGLEAIERQFGPALVEKHQPFSAMLIHDEWLVFGNVDVDGGIAKRQKELGPDFLISVRGGAPGASISPHDGRVISVSFGR